MTAPWHPRRARGRDLVREHALRLAPERLALDELASSSMRAR
jgi:hypothetical protein